MKKKNVNTKKKLFEMMDKLDPSFKQKLNESSDGNLEEKTNKEKIIDMIIQAGLDLANEQISQEEHDRKVKELENALKNI